MDHLLKLKNSEKMTVLRPLCYKKYNQGRKAYRLSSMYLLNRCVQAIDGLLFDIINVILEKIGGSIMQSIKNFQRRF
jgi:hypothetical protein